MLPCALHNIQILCPSGQAFFLIKKKPFQGMWESSNSVQLRDDEAHGNTILSVYGSKKGQGWWGRRHGLQTTTQDRRFPARGRRGTGGGGKETHTAARWLWGRLGWGRNNLARGRGLRLQLCQAYQRRYLPTTSVPPKWPPRRLSVVRHQNRAMEMPKQKRCQ